MYTALYRAERPEVFQEIIGQEHIVKILKHQIETNTVSHAYLFCGTRGTGKTSTARILAKAVNCLSDGEKPCGHCANCESIKNGDFMDVIEIDAASNNGVDNIRELKESVKYPPSMGRKKVYIIDEVHMLSSGAFNALLKTLEEPPEDVMFILATTEPQKLPATVLSRCMRLDFRRVSEKLIMGCMQKICDKKEMDITDNALKLLAANADGSVRDGLSILDQCLSTGEEEITRDTILEFLGTAGESFFLKLTELVSVRNIAEALLILDYALNSGKDVKQLMKDWMAHYRNLLITKFIKNPEDMLNMSTENIEKLREQSMQISIDEINNAVLTLAKSINDARWSTQPRILLELAIVSISTDFETSEIDKPVSAEVAPVARKNKEKLQNDEHLSFEPSKSKNDGKLIDKDDLWHKVFEEGENKMGSFNILRISSTLETLTDTDFQVLVKSKIALDYIKKNKSFIESVMESNTGVSRMMICKLAQNEKITSKYDEAQEIAQSIEDKLGINVEIK